MVFTLLSLPAFGGVQVALKSGDTVSTCVQPDAQSFYSFKPNCKEKATRAGREAELSYNSHGLRDIDYPAERKEGWTRIMVIGPSSMVAPGMAESEGPVRKLEKLLRKTNPKVEVINASVEGYSPVLQASRIKGWLKAYNPELTVLYVEFASAIQSDILFDPYVVRGADSISVKPESHGLSKLFSNQATAFAFESFWHRAALTNWCKLTNRRGRTLAMCQLTQTLRSIRVIQAQAEQAGSKFLLVFSPGRFQNSVNLSPIFSPGVASFFDRFTPTTFIADAEIQYALGMNNIHVKSIASLADPEYHLGNDYHLNERGADAMAKELAAVLIPAAGIVGPQPGAKPAGKKSKSK